MPGPVTEGRIAVRTAFGGWEISTALAFGIAAGMCAIIYYILRAFFNFTESAIGGLVGWIPGVNKWVNSKLEHAAQKATNWIGQAAISCEARSGAAFHAFADTMSSVGHEIEGQAIAYWQLAHWIYTLNKAIVTGEAFQEIFHNTITAQGKTAGRTSLDLGKLRKWLWKVVAGLVGLNLGAILKKLLADHKLTQQQIGALQGGYAVPGTIPLPRDLPSTRERAKTAERGNEALWDRLRDVSWRTAGVGAVALVTVALGRLGLGWMRCSNVTKVGKRLCGMDPRSLEALLAGTVAIIGGISIVQLAEALLAGEEEILKGVAAGFKELRGFNV